MRVSVFGSGYIGLVQAAVFADAGHQVCCMDIDAARIAALQAGEVPLHEPGLAALLQRTTATGDLHFTSAAADAVSWADVLFLAVGTPSTTDGAADLSAVQAVAEQIGRHMQSDKLVVNKSTVPVGSADRVTAIISQELAGRDAQWQVQVASNPEFLKEGSAVDDCQRPDRIVLGTDSPAAEATLRELYAPFNRNHEKILVMDTRSAELTKYAANAMLATKISFMNEMATLAERLGADIECIRRGIGSDPRIGYHFIYAGCGYGGACFPKDIKALIATATEVNYQAPLLRAVEHINQAQKRVLFERLQQHFSGDLRGRTVALWGLAFKPNTDDMREAPSLVLLESLWGAGVKVQAYDPAAMTNAQRLFGQRDDLHLMGTREAAARGADALIVATDWREFKVLDYAALRSLLKHPLVIDGRNLYQPERMAEEGFTYYGIGRQLFNGKPAAHQRQQ